MYIMYLKYKSIIFLFFYFLFFIFFKKKYIHIDMYVLFFFYVCDKIKKKKNQRKYLFKVINIRN